MIHEETVTPEALNLIRRFSADKQLQDFVLVGDTALALQLGHRKSANIDLSGTARFDGAEVAKHLEKEYRGWTVGFERDILFSRFNDIKVGITSQKYPMVAPIVTMDGVRMASLDDIGAMKMHAMVNSGRRQTDFVDMYYILEHRTLDALTKAYAAKYPDKNATLARNGLLYHVDMRKEPNLDLLLRPFDWEEISSRLTKAVIWPDEVFGKASKMQKKLGEKDRSLLKKQRKKGKGQ